MVVDLDMAIEVVGVPILREADGLAMSSRNAYLSAEERARAVELYAVLRKVAAGMTVEEGRAALLAAGFERVDYLEERGAGGCLGRRLWVRRG